jgi:hypothetical protein
MTEELSTYVRKQAERRFHGLQLGHQTLSISRAAPGAALVFGGAWLLYRNLLYGDFISGWIVLLAVVLIGTGCLVLPYARKTAG